jgi:hypothetical protein
LDLRVFLEVGFAFSIFEFRNLRGNFGGLATRTKITLLVSFMELCCGQSIHRLAALERTARRHLALLTWHLASSFLSPF